MGSQAATGVLGALGLAALAVFVPVLWQRAQWFSTFVHEAGHADRPVRRGPRDLPGRARTVLLVVIFVVVALLLMTGDTFSVVIVATVLAALALLLHRAGPASQTLAALTAAWFLLLAGLRDRLELSRVIFRSGGRDDASQLAEQTGIPAVVWVGAFTVFAGYALHLTSRWLLIDPTT